jgi:hypothetical protein
MAANALLLEIVQMHAELPADAEDICATGCRDNGLKVAAHRGSSCNTEQGHGMHASSCASLHVT